MAVVAMVTYIFANSESGQIRREVVGKIAELTLKFQVLQNESTSTRDELSENPNQRETETKEMKIMVESKSGIK